MQSDKPAPTDQQDLHSDNVEATPPVDQGVSRIAIPTTNVRIVDIDLSFSQWVVLIIKTTLAGLVAMLGLGILVLIAVMVVAVPDWGSWFSNEDGLGDNGDAFPANPLELFDTDGDGIGDNGDTPSETRQCTYYAGDAPAVSRKWTVTVDGLTCPNTSTRGEWVGNLQR